MSLNEPIPEVVRTALAGLEGASDRAIAIVLGAIVEDRLETTIKAHMIENNQVSRRLFGRGLGSFASQIDLGFLLALYDLQTLEALHSIREVRNAFAHSIAEISFDDPDIVSRARQLTFIDVHTYYRSGLPWRERFIASAKFMLGMFFLLEMNATRPERPL